MMAKNYTGNRRSARRVVGRDLTESGVGSAVLCPGYMFLHLSCEWPVGRIGSCDLCDGSVQQGTSYYYLLLSLLNHQIFYQRQYDFPPFS